MRLDEYLASRDARYLQALNDGRSAIEFEMSDLAWRGYLEGGQGRHH